MENNNQENINRKLISRKSLLFAAGIVIFILLGFWLMYEPYEKYRISPEEMLNKAMKFEHVIPPKKLKDIINAEDSQKYRFIDLRSAQEYKEGHLPEAINIPAGKLLYDEYTDILNQDKYINILYHTDQSRAGGPWMILEQIGYSNNTVLQGGYEFAKDYLAGEYSAETASPQDEKPMYDYAQIMQKLSGSDAESETAPSTDNDVQDIIDNSEKTEEVGGC